MNILLLSTGSVSAYLSHKLAYQLKEDGHEVKHYMTKAAGELMMYSKGSLSTTSNTNVSFGQSFYTGHFSSYYTLTHEIADWHDKAGHPVGHIDLVRWADVCVVCPADYNIVGKMANGVADDFVTSVLAAWMGCGKKLYICEAMNSMMYQGPVYQRNRTYLDSLDFVRFIEPTVKNLACGGIGIGGLADITTVKNIVEGHVWHQPIKQEDLLGKPVYNGPAEIAKGMFGKFICDDMLNEFVRGKCREKFRDYIPRFYEPGAFGAIRKFDIHEGMDIYTHDGADVYPVEEGVVTAVYEFTGKNANCDWWNPTWCIKVQGKSGVVTYGELAKPRDGIQVGKKVYPCISIGHVTPVLKPEKYRPDIRNHSVAMLHLELRTETCHLDGWKLDGQRDKKLLDPTPYLKSKDLITV